MAVFFTSDTHFGSKDMVFMSMRLFSSVNEMNDYIIFNWNNTVGDNDTVYHLGDVGDLDVVKDLRGNKILICGNHEHYISYNEGIVYQKLEGRLLNAGFNEVYPERFQTEISDMGLMNLVHKPSYSDLSMFNLFGHVHEFYFTTLFGLNVGVDCNNFKLVDENRLRHYYIRIKSNKGAGSVYTPFE